MNPYSYLICSAAAAGDRERVLALWSFSTPEARHAALAVACDGHADVVRALLERGVPPEWCFDGPCRVEAPLVNAARRGDPEIARLLLEHGADPHRVCGEDTPLTAAIGSGLRETVLTLVEAGVDVHRAPCGTPPLVLAFEHADVVDALLEAGASPNALDAEGVPVLGRAAASGDLLLLQRLIDAGAELEHGGDAALEQAARYNQSAAVDCLLAWGASPCRVDADLGLAASAGRCEAVTRLLDAGNPRDRLDRYGRSPLGMAVRSERAGAVAVLLERGAPASQPYHHEDRKGVLSLWEAFAPGILGLSVRMGNDAITALLLRAGADPNERNVFGETPLHDARTEHAVRLLVRFGAEIDARDENGRSPLLASVEHGRNESVGLALLELGAPTDGCGENSLQLASARGWRDLEKALEARGIAPEDGRG